MDSRNTITVQHHFELINKLKALNALPVSDVIDFERGLCQGISLLHVQFSALGKVDAFYHLLNRLIFFPPWATLILKKYLHEDAYSKNEVISDLKRNSKDFLRMTGEEKNNIKAEKINTKKNLQEIVNLVALINTLLIYHNPEELLKFYPLHMIPSLIDFNYSLQLLLPNKIAGSLLHVASDTDFYDKKELILIIDLITVTLEILNIKVDILFKKYGHCNVITYNKNKEGYDCCFSGSAVKRFFHKTQLIQLVDELFIDFSSDKSIPISISYIFNKNNISLSRKFMRFIELYLQEKRKEFIFPKNDIDHKHFICLAIMYAPLESIKKILPDLSQISFEKAWLYYDFALYFHRFDILKHFLNQIDVNALYDGNYFLKAYVRLNKYQCVQFLLENGANFNVKDLSGNTALHEAIHPARYDMLILLLRYSSGLDLNIVNNDGKSPLHLAVEMNDNALAELLLQHKADPNIKFLNQKTLLHVVAERGNLTLFKLLIQYGAQYYRDANLLTPEDCALARGNLDIVEYCRQHFPRTVILSPNKLPLSPRKSNQSSTAIMLSPLKSPLKFPLNIPRNKENIDSHEDMNEVQEPKKLDINNSPEPKRPIDEVVAPEGGTRNVRRKLF